MLQAPIRRTRPLFAKLLALTALGALASPSAAQCQIAPEISRSSSELGGAQREAVKEFATCVTPGLSAAEPLKIKEARELALEPLRDSQVSAPFRIELSKQFEATLTALAASERYLVAINALVIAGELATDQGLSIAEKQLANPAAAVRYEAVYAFNRTFEAVLRSSPALRPDRLERAIQTLGRQLEIEQDPRVTDALARAIATAITIELPGFEAVRSRAVSELSTRIGARLKARAGKPMDPPLMETAISAGAAVRDALANQGPQHRLSDGAITDASGLGGDMLATVDRMVRAKGELEPIAGGDSTEEAAAKVQARLLPSQVVALAETIIAVSGVNSTVTRLADLLKTAKPLDDGRFLDGVQQLIGPDGAVIKQKGFKPNRFLP